MDPRSRSTAILEARALLESNPVYLDTETTGMHFTSEVIEIGIIDDQGQVLFDQLVRPRGKMDPAAGRVHGITLEMLVGAPTWEQVWPQAEAVLAGKRIGVYNVEFDLRLMKQTHLRSWLTWSLPEANFFDIMKLYARFHGDWDPIRKSYRYQSLEIAGRQCGIRLPNAHRAVDDCHLTRALLHYMADGV
ncbi:MAG TPA: 3'-5' exonuclease [Anaerolineales bacterium]|nr:3'-5' exonuclease [Anaerolineales bacterium]